MLQYEGELTPERILDYIDTHFAQPIAPRDVAAAMHYSLCHLTHVARKALGASIGDLILQRRIWAAQRLLAETVLPVAVIAQAVGFSDTAYFSRRFSQTTGSSPSRWRKGRENTHAHRRCHACGTLLPLLFAG